MNLKPVFFRVLWLTLALSLPASCRSLPPAPMPAGVVLKPGQYIQRFYRDPQLEPVKAAYVLKPFRVERATGVAPDTMAALFAEELEKAWEANGLKVAPGPESLKVEGAIYLVRLKGTWVRFIIGRLHISLAVSGTIRRGDQVLFAFQDRVDLTSPIKPGRGAPKETELLLRQAAREVAHHLLNELLIYGGPGE